MQEIRVVVALASPLLADMIGELLAPEPDIRLVAEIRRESDLIAELHATPADVLVVAVDSASISRRCRELALEFPNLCVVSLEERATRARVQRGQESVIALEELSPAHLLAAIRGSKPLTEEQM